VLLPVAAVMIVPAVTMPATVVNIIAVARIIIIIIPAVGTGAVVIIWIVAAAIIAAAGGDAAIAITIPIGAAAERQCTRQSRYRQLDFPGAHRNSPKTRLLKKITRRS
jgi:hypothetical protein